MSYPYRPERSMRKRTWREAFRLYLHDPHASRLVRMILVKVIPVLFGVDVIDDLVPFVGQLDDVALPFLAGSILVMLFRVSKYRRTPPQKPQPPLMVARPRQWDPPRPSARPQRRPLPRGRS